MLTGGGALSANPASADTGAAANTPMPSTPRTPGNEPLPGGAAAPPPTPPSSMTGPNKTAGKGR